MARPIEKRKHIEAGVVWVVAEKGLRGTTIQDIANASNVSPGLLYRYWRNRDDLAADVYRSHYLDLEGRLLKLAAKETLGLDKLRVMIRGFLRFADENPVVLKFLLLAQHDLQQQVPEEQAVRATLLPLIRQIVAEEAMHRIDPNLALQIILGIVLQPVVGVIYGHLTPPATQYAADIIAALERALLAPPLSVSDTSFSLREEALP